MESKTGFDSNKDALTSPNISGFDRDDSHERGRTFVYEILKGHFNPDNTWRSSQELRMQYLQLTDGLIQKMTEGIKKVNPETGEMEAHIPSTIVFLDKSARPLSHLVRELWPIFAKDPKTGETPIMPAFKFLNIDREQWINQFDQHGNGMMDIDKIDPSIIRGLRSIFLTPEGKEQVISRGITDAVDIMPTILDNENVLIVDETYSTGRTARIAAELLQRALPQSYVDSTHWMHSLFKLDGGSIRNDVPVWYKDNTILGRGVGNRYADSTRNQNLTEVSKEDYYRTVGRWFLSSPLQHGPDELYLQLIKEIKELAINPDVPIIPSIMRGEEDMDNRFITYNYPDIDLSSLAEKDKNILIENTLKRMKSIKDASLEDSKHFYTPSTPRPRRR